MSTILILLSVSASVVAQGRGVRNYAKKIQNHHVDRYMLPSRVEQFMVLIRCRDVICHFRLSGYDIDYLLVRTVELFQMAPKFVFANSQRPSPLITAHKTQPFAKSTSM